jgi:hypothetical protein
LLLLLLLLLAWIAKLVVVMLVPVLAVRRVVLFPLLVVSPSSLPELVLASALTLAPPRPLERSWPSLNPA